MKSFWQRVFYQIIVNWDKVKSQLSMLLILLILILWKEKRLWIDRLRGLKKNMLKKSQHGIKWLKMMLLSKSNKLKGNKLEDLHNKLFKSHHLTKPNPCHQHNFLGFKINNINKRIQKHNKINKEIWRHKTN